MSDLTRFPSSVIDSSADEAKLVARAKEDRQAFAPIYRRYVEPVYRYCYYRLGSRKAAEDATSQVFAKALAALPSHRQERSFRSWVFAIAHNVVADIYRDQQPDQGLEAAARVADAGPSPEDLAVAGEAREAVHRLLSRLPTNQRQVLELRLAGLTGIEIAEVLGRTPAAVKIARVRAHARIRELMGQAKPGQEANHAT